MLTGTAAKNHAGPAVALSFATAGVVCALAALCYAEFASTIPVAGSAYTFAYSTIGELPAWIIGWDLVLELALGSAVVAVGWSGYVQSLLASGGVTLPHALSGAETGGWSFNLPAVLIVLLLTGILVIGVHLSAEITRVIVAIKVTVVLIVIVAGLFFVKAANYHPYLPPAEEAAAGTGGKAPLVQVLFGYTPTDFGVMGIFTAAAVVFFAFIGFDVVATAAEETRNPQRDMPRGIIASLLICTLLYMLVATVVTGMQKYTRLSDDAPLSDAFKAVGQHAFADIIDVGAVAGLTSVTMILLLGQSRVFFAMSRDGLLPRTFSTVNPRLGTPSHALTMLGLVVAVMAGLIPLEELSELVNIGTLFAFIVVSVGVVVLRRTRPDLPRAFRCPWVPTLPVLSVLASLWLMLNLPVATWWRFLVWLVIGLGVYFLYGRRHSRLRLPAAPFPRRED